MYSAAPPARPGAPQLSFVNLSVLRGDYNPTPGPRFLRAPSVSSVVQAFREAAPPFALFCEGWEPGLQVFADS